MLYLNKNTYIYRNIFNRNVIDILLKTALPWNKSVLSGKDGLWDRMAVGVSGLCLLHCFATIVIVAFLSTAAGVFLNPVIHEIGIGIAIVLGIFAFGRGIVDHGLLVPAAIGTVGIAIMITAIIVGHSAGYVLAELVFTMLGVGVLAYGHYLNYRASH